MSCVFAVQKHFSHAANNIAMLALWSRLKYFNDYWMDYHEILYRHLWSPMNLIDFGDPLLSFSTTGRSEFLLILWNISTFTWWMGTNLCADIHGSQMMNPILLFSSRHHGVIICDFEWNVSTTIGWIVVRFVTQIHAPLTMNCNVQCFGLWPKTNGIPISLICTLCLLLISNC